MLAARADPQLRRLDRSIAVLETAAPAVRMRKQWLLLALRADAEPDARPVAWPVSLMVRASWSDDSADGREATHSGGWRARP